TLPGKRAWQRRAPGLRTRARLDVVTARRSTHRRATRSVRVAAGKVIRVPQGVPDAQSAEPPGKESRAGDLRSGVARLRNGRPGDRRFPGAAFQEPAGLRGHVASYRGEQEDSRAGAQFSRTRLHLANCLWPLEADVPS